MLIVLTVIAVIFLLYLLALRGRTNHPDLPELRKWRYAHRGLHGNGVPENSMLAFQKAMDSGYGIELDVHLLADGNLAVIHDASLKRTANEDVTIEELTTGQLQAYRLEGTQEQIPALRHVLDMISGKIPVIIELKSENDNYAELTETACRMLEDYQGLYCIESFDPRCIRLLRKYHPQIIRGQLSYNSLHDCPEVSYGLRFLMTNLLSNFWNLPDFIAYCYNDRNRFSVYISRKLWNIQGVAWTLRTPEDFEDAVKDNWIPIFEYFEP